MNTSDKTIGNIVAKIAIISVIVTSIGGAIVYNIINNKFNKEINLLKEEVKILREESKKQEIKLESDNNIDVEETTNKVDINKAESNNNDNKVLNSTKVLDEVFDIMNKANDELEKVHSKITNSGTFSGLQGIFDTLSNYGSQLIDQASKLDLSNVGGVETSDTITSIGYELQGLSDTDNMADEALNIMGRMGEFIAYIDYSYNNSDNN